MTLRELADELKNIFDFKYITVEERGLIFLHNTEYGIPYYENGWWYMSVVVSFSDERLKEKLDLSEYMDENGFVDYSKCIIEV